ncbi:MAG: hypothetical protein J4G00_10330 [Actinomycetia bacterium]|nr:hypothetical protein [Actinomycetes bacterium]
MTPILPPSPSLRVAGEWAVCSPPLVSLHYGVVVLDSRAVRRGLKGLSPQVWGVVCLANPETLQTDRVDLGSMGASLRAGADAVATVRSVPEAVKVVDSGWVVGSMDRSSLFSITLPLVIKRSVLGRLLSEASPVGSVNPIQEMVNAGGRVRAVFQSI